MTLVPCPSPPILVKSMSDVETDTIVDLLLQDIIDNVVKTHSVANHVKDLRYVKLNERQNIFDTLQNFIFYLLLKFQIIFYRRQFPATVTFVAKNGSHTSKRARLKCTDKYFCVDRTRVFYEYISRVYFNNSCVFINLIDGQVILLKSKQTWGIYKTISRNLQYHVRYNKIDINISKYKNIKNTVTVY